MSEKWKDRLTDVIVWSGLALLMAYGLPLWLMFPLLILPILGLLVFWTVHEWRAARRRRDPPS